MNKKEFFKAFKDAILPPTLKAYVVGAVHTMLPSAKVVFDYAHHAPASCVQSLVNNTTKCVITFNPLSILEMICSFYDSRYYFTLLLKILNEVSNLNDTEDIGTSRVHKIQYCINHTVSYYESLYLYLAAHEVFHKMFTLSGKPMRKILEDFVAQYPNIPLRLANFISNTVEDATIQRLGYPISNSDIQQAFNYWQDKLQGSGRVEYYIDNCSGSMKEKLYFFIVYFYSQHSASARQKLLAFKESIELPQDIIDEFDNCVSINDSEERAKEIYFVLVPMVYQWFLVPAQKQKQMQKQQSNQDMLDASGIADPDDTEEDDEESEGNPDSEQPEDDEGNPSDCDGESDNDEDTSESGDEDTESYDEDEPENSSDLEDDDESDKDSESDSKSDSDAENKAKNQSEDEEDSDDTSDAEDDGTDEQESSEADNDSDPSKGCGDGNTELTEEELEQVVNELNQALNDALDSLPEDSDVQDMADMDENTEEEEPNVTIELNADAVHNISDLILNAPDKDCDEIAMTHFYDNCCATFEDLMNDGVKTFYHQDDGDLDVDRILDPDLYGDVDIFKNTERYINELRMKICFILDASGSMFYEPFYECASVITALKSSFAKLNVASRLVTFSDMAYVLTDYQHQFRDLRSLYNICAINEELPGLGSGTELDKALDIELQDEALLTFGDSKLLIIVTDGDTRSQSKCIAQLAELASQGVNILGLYLGDDAGYGFSKMFEPYDSIILPQDRVELELAQLIYEYIIDKFMIIK